MVERSARRAMDRFRRWIGAEIEQLVMHSAHRFGWAKRCTAQLAQDRRHTRNDRRAALASQRRQLHRQFSHRSRIDRHASRRNRACAADRFKRPGLPQRQDE
ncbi:MAG: hypothetical protein ACKVS9_13680 [Phycisphaerae bacterium]